MVADANDANAHDPHKQTYQPLPPDVSSVLFVVAMAAEAAPLRKIFDLQPDPAIDNDDAADLDASFCDFFTNPWFLTRATTASPAKKLRISLVLAKVLDNCRNGWFYDPA